MKGYEREGEVEGLGEGRVVRGGEGRWSGLGRKGRGRGMRGGWDMEGWEREGMWRRCEREGIGEGADVEWEGIWRGVEERGIRQEG